MKINKSELIGLLQGVSSYIEMTKTAAAPAMDSPRLEKAIGTLCDQGILLQEKRAQIIDSIQRDPNKMCDMLEKLASKVGSASLGAGDNNEVDPAGDEFAEFCLR